MVTVDMRLSTEMQRTLVCVLRPDYQRAHHTPEGLAWTVNDMGRECFSLSTTLNALLKRGLIEIRTPKSMRKESSGVRAIFSTVHVTEKGMPFAVAAEAARKAKMIVRKSGRGV